MVSVIPSISQHTPTLWQEAQVDVWCCGSCMKTTSGGVWNYTTTSDNGRAKKPLEHFNLSLATHIFNYPNRRQWEL
uniref:Uncharacterized protein n=1 Tax=Chelonoidis abingdonii TaxID=106734 RepID=A0A8C0QSE4_CHEAB